MALNANLSIAHSYRALLREGLDEMLGEPPGHKSPFVCFGRLRLLLEAHPLDSTEFGLAVNRLANAQRYLETDEHGAARYELRLLRRSHKEYRTDPTSSGHWRCLMFSIATLSLYHAESDPVKGDDAWVQRARMQKPQRHRLLHGYPLAAAKRRRRPIQPPRDLFFDPQVGRGLLVDVPPHPFCSPAVSSCGLCTFPHPRNHAGQPGKVVKHAGREIDGRLTRQPALTRRRVAALYFGLECLAMIGRLGFAVFLTVGFVAAIGLTSGMNITSPIAVRLCEGFFLWSLVLISCDTSRRA
jgi:hypothetical protein